MRCGFPAHARRVAAVTALVAAVAVAGCGDDSDESAGDLGGSKGQTTLSFLTPVPRSVSYYPLIVAEQLGYFEQEGVEVKAEPIGQLLPSVAIQAGNADLAGTPAADVLTGTERGGEFRVVYEFYQLNPNEIMVPTDGPSSVAGLEGGTVGLASNRGTDQARLANALRREGLPEDSVKTTVIGENSFNIARAMKAGDIQGFMGSFIEEIGINEQGVPTRNIMPAEMQTMPSSVFFAKPETVSAKREAIQGFLRAWVKAQYAGHARPEILKAMVQQEVPEEWRNERAGQATFEKTLEVLEPQTEQLGGLRPDQWRAADEDERASGNLKETVDLDAILDDQFIGPANRFDRTQVEADMDRWAEENQ